MLNDKQYLLKEIFSKAVDGSCSNAYGVILNVLNSLPLEAKRVQFSLNDIKQALKPLSNKWEKEIDKATK